jgi:hypothetical protein
MALWGNKDLVYSDGTISINFGTKVITGSGTTFTTAGIGTGDVITVGSGATYGYAVISAITSDTQLGITSTQFFVPGITTVPSGTSYSISQEPSYTLFDSVYRAPESKTSGFSTSPVFTGVFGVDQYEVAAAAVTTVGGKAAAYAVAHSGWVGIMTYIDTHGNLRVKSEVLVAGGINTVSTYDASDDTKFPDNYITISSQPVGVATTSGGTAVFSVTAAATPTASLIYQWQQSTGGAYSTLSNGGQISGATSSSVSIANTNSSRNGYNYRVVITTAGGASKTSDSATLTIV